MSCSSLGLILWVQDMPFQCLLKGQVLSVSVLINDWVYNGELICPACSDFCPNCLLPHQLPPLNTTTRTLPIGQSTPPTCHPCCSISHTHLHAYILNELQMMVSCVVKMVSPFLLDPCSSSSSLVVTLWLLLLNLVPLLAGFILCVWNWPNSVWVELKCQLHAWGTCFASWSFFRRGFFQEGSTKGSRLPQLAPTTVLCLGEYHHPGYRPLKIRQLTTGGGHGTRGVTYTFET